MTQEIIVKLAEMNDLLAQCGVACQQDAEIQTLLDLINQLVDLLNLIS